MIFIEKPVSCQAAEEHTPLFGRCVCHVVLQLTKQLIIFQIWKYTEERIENTYIGKVEQKEITLFLVSINDLYIVNLK